MTRLFFFLVFVALKCPALFAQSDITQSLNHYIAFLDKSSAVVTKRFEMLSNYQVNVDQFRKKPGAMRALPSSGPLEDYYFKKALSAPALTAAEKDKLNAGAHAIWELATLLDVACKRLETHVHLKGFENDDFQQSDQIVVEIQSLIRRYSNQKTAFYHQIQEVYLKHQHFSAGDPYYMAEKAIEQVLHSQQHLLDSLPYYLNANTRSAWPVEMVRQSMLADEQFLATIGNSQSKLRYPASDALAAFKSSLASIQDVKRRIIDGYTFAAKQSAEHGNEAYLSLINHFNNDLLAFYKSFVDYSQGARRMLYYPAFSPVFKTPESTNNVKKVTVTAPFQDKPLIDFSLKKVSEPAPPALNRTLNEYVDFVNESLRQMHLLQLTLRNYQSAAAYYRDPEKARSRPALTYSHEKFEIPASAFALLINASKSIPDAYRKSINSQTEVLMNILKEMDLLSIELIAYTSDKQYLNDRLKRSDAILERYLVLFETFDKKKEQLYNDLRRIHESFPAASPTSSWIVAGNALEQTMDDDRAVLFGIRNFLKGETAQLPETKKIEADAHQLIADEYQNLKGLPRYGRSNGLCPYSPYEDLAGNTERFAVMSQKVKAPAQGSTRHPFEAFYYFYNNELVYEYNKFVKLAKGGLLKAVNQPDLFIFPKSDVSPAAKPLQTQPERNEKDISAEPEPNLAATQKPVNGALSTNNPAEPEAKPTVELRTDTVYVERVRVDTVYVGRGISGDNITRSLDGFAANNMVLLLDVSSSMNSPFKMPLLKRSIKSMLSLLRPEDQISIVLYSGKARVVLKPTSGSKSAEIARMIDLLQSDGDTDGNEGIRLAYKTANKQYIRGGNNRIILATDGEFPVSDEVTRMIGENARQDLYLTVFTFGRHAHTGQKLKKLSELGKGSYAHVTEESADLQLILEAQGKRLSDK
jgi:hypothetical protein